MPGIWHTSHVPAVAHDGAVFFHVQVHRVHPATAPVADLPQVESVLLGRRERSLPCRVLQAPQVIRGVEALAVDQPLDLPAGAAAFDLEDQPVV